MLTSTMNILNWLQCEASKINPIDAYAYVFTGYMCVRVSICVCVLVFVEMYKKVAKTWILYFKSMNSAMSNVSLFSDNAIEKLINLS